MNAHTVKGLTTIEAKARQQSQGYNALPDREKRSFIKIIAGVLTEPMIFLLVSVVVVYFLLGDKTEAMVLMVSVLVIIGIELYQDSKTEKALEALRGLASPSCNVIRDGKHMVIPSRELVVGDVFLVSEGERVPADAVLLDAENIMADESLLTGESIPVDKDEAVTDDEKKRKIFSGSMIVKGHGMAEVTAIGGETEIGQIGSSLNTIKPEKTLLKREVDRVVKTLAVVAVAASVLLALVYWLTRGDLLHGFLAGLTLSIAILPEEFPVVLTVFMALGAWRLAKNNVLARKSQTIETLGSATVLCTDKTGTLTENCMQVDCVTDAHGSESIHGSDDYTQVVDYGVLASQIKPFDPMEEAFIKAGTGLHDDISSVYGEMTIIKEYPLEESSLSVVHVWGNGEKQEVVALKGAPEVVFALCGVKGKHSEQLRLRVKELASKGLRVIAVAKGAPRDELPKERDAYSYTFLGLVALADPIRAEAADAVALCRKAGIRVIMITGDYAETARRIGSVIGLDSERVVTGDDFAAMSESERDEVIKTTSIFSRVVPAQKLLIVNALKDNGEVVAMTGDGVNDAPALKSAHIGIAMGQRGTDVAREAASIVLLDDNFASIVQGVRTGRRIFANLQKAMIYILTVHMPIIMLSLVPVFFGWSLVLLPIHIVFIEFIIDPSCTLIFEGEDEEPDTMQRPPRQLGSALFSRAMVLLSFMTGLFISGVIVVGHWLMLEYGWSEDKARAITFLLIILTNIMMIMVISGRRVVGQAFSSGHANALAIIVAVAIAALVVVYTIEPVRTLFHFAPISLIEAAMAFGIASIATLVLLPLRKYVFARSGHL
ncbi:MAG: cation-translocating P-type ATPase [Candidatus Saccharimonadales bacterium]